MRNGPGEPLPRLVVAAQYLAVAMAGSVFALVVWQALKLQTRHALAFFVGIAMLAAGTLLLRWGRDLLLYLLAFNLPLTSIKKTFLLTQETTFVTPGIGVGLQELALAALYFVWAVRIFVTRQDPLPRLRRMDLWVLAFLGAHVLSMATSYSRELTFLESIRLAELSLFYFYLSRQVRREHLVWLAAGLMFAIALQSSLAVVQQRTGELMGIGRTKGAEGKDYEQYAVPGFESVRRAEGTTFDSHALGLFMATTLPLPLAMAVSPALPPTVRTVAGAAVVIGLPGLIASFSRASWVAFTGGVLILAWFFVRWRQTRTIFLGVAIALCISAPLLLPFAKHVRQRLVEAPPELISARIETVEMAWVMWKERPLTGIGANAYMRGVEDRLSVFEGEPYFIPVHNAIIFVLAETGIIGLLAYMTLMTAVFVRCWRASKSEDPLLRVFGGGLFAGMAALQIGGISDPIYITDVVYYTIWFLIGLSAAVAGLASSGRTTGPLPS